MKLLIAQDEAFFFQPKSIDIFLISPGKHMLWYSLEVPHQGASNKYPQQMFSWRNKKKYCVDTHLKCTCILELW